MLLFGTSDSSCQGGASTAAGPGALIHGDRFDGGADVGVFAVFGGEDPSSAGDLVGFRTAR